MKFAQRFMEYEEIIGNGLVPVALFGDITKIQELGQPKVLTIIMSKPMRL